METCVAIVLLLLSARIWFRGYRREKMEKMEAQTKIRNEYLAAGKAPPGTAVQKIIFFVLLAIAALLLIALLHKEGSILD
jgi:hypothetical protein